MSVHVIYYKGGAKMMRPVESRESYMTLRGSRKQKATVMAVRGGDEAQKTHLMQMNYSCLPGEDGKLKGASQPSNTVGMDIDHLKAEEMERVRERILSKREELGLLMLEKSARGAGYHLVFRRRAELSQEENLRRASELLEVEYDQGAKDITRVFFTTTDSEDDLLFLDDELFEIGTIEANTDLLDLSDGNCGSDGKNESDGSNGNCGNGEDCKSAPTSKSASTSDSEGSVTVLQCYSSDDGRSKR